MSDFPRWKYALVALAMLFGIVYALPNAFVPLPAVQVTANKGSAPIDDALRQKVSDALAKDHIATGEVVAQGDQLLATFANADVQKNGADTIKTLLGDGYTVAFKLQSTVPHWLTMIGANSMPLGLDLQGGVHFLMQVDQSGVLDKLENSYADDIRNQLRDKNIRYESVARSTVAGQGIVVVLRSAADRSSAADLIAGNSPDLAVTDGPSTGDRYVLYAAIKPTKLRDLSLGTIKQNLATLRNRINNLGVSEPLIQQQGEDHIVVELAGVQDPTEAKKLIGATATPEYRPGIGYPNDPRALDAARTGSIPPDANLYYTSQGHAPVLVGKRPIVTGDELINASSGVDPNNGTPSVNVTLNASGAKKMQEFTNANVGKPMAVVLINTVYETSTVNGKEVRTPKTTYSVINDATIQSPFGKEFSTNGLGSPKEASDLALLLKSGSLAAPMDIVEEYVIGPSLG